MSDAPDANDRKRAGQSPFAEASVVDAPPPEDDEVEADSGESKSTWSQAACAT